jgi:hypothetical protein
MFQRVTRVLIGFVPSLSHLTVERLMKFSVAPLLTCTVLFSLPLSNCKEIGSLNLLPFIIYIFLRCRDCSRPGF